MPTCRPGWGKSKAMMQRKGAPQGQHVTLRKNLSGCSAEPFMSPLCGCFLHSSCCSCIGPEAASDMAFASEVTWLWPGSRKGRSGSGASRSPQAAALTAAEAVSLAESTRAAPCHLLQRRHANMSKVHAEVFIRHTQQTNLPFLSVWTPWSPARPLLMPVTIELDRSTTA